MCLNYNGSLEQIQINLFEETVFRGSEFNIFQYSILCLWHDRLEGTAWFDLNLLSTELCAYLRVGISALKTATLVESFIKHNIFLQELNGSKLRICLVLFLKNTF